MAFELNKNQDNTPSLDVWKEIVKRSRNDFFKKIIRMKFGRPYYPSDFDKFDLRMMTNEIGMVYYDGEYLGGMTQEIKFEKGSFSLVQNFIPKGVKK